MVHLFIKPYWFIEVNTKVVHNYLILKGGTMSKDEHQMKIRLPAELKNKIESASKTNTRSMNAEIVQRLEVSFLNEVSSSELISAKDAKHIANNAREKLSSIIFKRTFEEINKKIRLGHTQFYVDLTDLNLQGLSDDDFITVFQLTFPKLKKMGYVIIDDFWDISGFMVEIPQA